MKWKKKLFRKPNSPNESTSLQGSIDSFEITEANAKVKDEAQEQVKKQPTSLRIVVDDGVEDTEEREPDVTKTGARVERTKNMEGQDQVKRPTTSYLNEVVDVGVQGQQPSNTTARSHQYYSTSFYHPPGSLEISMTDRNGSCVVKNCKKDTSLFQFGDIIDSMDGRVFHGLGIERWEEITKETKEQEKGEDQKDVDKEGRMDNKWSFFNVRRLMYGGSVPDVKEPSAKKKQTEKPEEQEEVKTQPTNYLNDTVDGGVQDIEGELGQERNLPSMELDREQNSFDFAVIVKIDTDKTENATSKLFLDQQVCSSLNMSGDENTTHATEISGLTDVEFIAQQQTQRRQGIHEANARAIGAGIIVGLITLPKSIVFAPIAALSAAYIAQQDGLAGDVLKATGQIAIAARDKAVEANEQFDLSERVKTVIQQVVDDVREEDNKHKVSEAIKTQIEQTLQKGEELERAIFNVKTFTSAELSESYSRAFSGSYEELNDSKDHLSPKGESYSRAFSGSYEELNDSKDYLSTKGDYDDYDGGNIGKTLSTSIKPNLSGGPRPAKEIVLPRNDSHEIEKKPEDSIDDPKSAKESVLPEYTGNCEIEKRTKNSIEVERSCDDPRSVKESVLSKDRDVDGKIGWDNARSSKEFVLPQSADVNEVEKRTKDIDGKVGWDDPMSAQKSIFTENRDDCKLEKKPLDYIDEKIGWDPISAKESVLPENTDAHELEKIPLDSINGKLGWDDPISARESVLPDNLDANEAEERPLDSIDEEPLGDDPISAKESAHPAITDGPEVAKNPKGSIRKKGSWNEPRSAQESYHPGNTNGYESGMEAEDSFDEYQCWDGITILSSKTLSSKRKGRIISNSVSVDSKRDDIQKPSNHKTSIDNRRNISSFSSTTSKPADASPIPAPIPPPLHLPRGHLLSNTHKLRLPPLNTIGAAAREPTKSFRKIDISTTFKKTIDSEDTQKNSTALKKTTDSEDTQKLSSIDFAMTSNNKTSKKNQFFLRLRNASPFRRRKCDGVLPGDSQEQHSHEGSLPSDSQEQNLPEEYDNVGQAYPPKVNASLEHKRPSTSLDSVGSGALQEQSSHEECFDYSPEEYFEDQAYPKPITFFSRLRNASPFRRRKRDEVSPSDSQEQHSHEGSLPSASRDQNIPGEDNAAIQVCPTPTVKTSMEHERPNTSLDSVGLDSLQEQNSPKEYFEDKNCTKSTESILCSDGGSLKVSVFKQCTDEYEVRIKSEDSASENKMAILEI